MKQLDNFSKRILVFGIALATVLMAASLFVSTLNKATAGTNSTSANQVGLFQMCSYVAGDGTQYVIFLNTATGATELWWYSKDDHWVKAGHQDQVPLPSIF